MVYTKRKLVANRSDLESLSEDVKIVLKQNSNMDMCSFNVKPSSTRNVPDETKRLLSEAVYQVKNLIELKIEKNRLNKSIMKAESEYIGLNSPMVRKIQNSLGLLTVTEFENEIRSVLSKRMNLSDWGISVHSNSLDISCYRGIEKWFRHGSFVYEEYDGAMQIYEGAENDKEYQNYLNRYRSTLPIKGNFTEYLELGDKDWLSYHSCYHIRLSKPLTKEYVKELCKEITS